MKKLLLWVFNLFLNKKKRHHKKVNNSKIIGVDKIFKKDINNSSIIMGKHVDFVISVNTEKNKSIGFHFYIKEKRLVLNHKNKTFEYLKVEYVKVK